MGAPHEQNEPQGVKAIFIEEFGGKVSYHNSKNTKLNVKNAGGVAKGVGASTDLSQQLFHYMFAKESTFFLKGSPGPTF